MWIAVIATIVIWLTVLTVAAAIAVSDLERRIAVLEDRWAQDRAEGWSDQK